jgi:hypothetical protein
VPATTINNVVSRPDRLLRQHRELILLLADGLYRRSHRVPDRPSCSHPLSISTQTVYIILDMVKSSSKSKQPLLDQPFSFKQLIAQYISFRASIPSFFFFPPRKKHLWLTQFSQRLETLSRSHSTLSPPCPPDLPSSSLRPTLHILRCRPASGTSGRHLLHSQGTRAPQERPGEGGCGETGLGGDGWKGGVAP